MFTALRKLVTNEQTGKHAFPEGIRAMGQNLQRKFARGVHYNMKIIIKGDRNTGKSCLFHRLQGGKFSEEYLPTHEIQVTSIQWSYKATDDIVKVEVWDVVDKGRRPKKHLDSLKLTSTDDAVDSCLDAEFIDVYKNTHGVIMLLDITKQWTYEYIAREIDKVPAHIPVLILENFRDMGEHRTVLGDSVTQLAQATMRPPGSAQIRCAEASMRNGYGLKYVYKFFNLPFLQLQKETLQRQLATNTEEVKSTISELNALSESEEQNYELFLEGLEVKRKTRVEEQKALAEQRVANEQATLAAKATTAMTSRTSSKTDTKEPTTTTATITTTAEAKTTGVGGSSRKTTTPRRPAPPEKHSPDPPADHPKPTLTKRISKLFSGAADETRTSPPPPGEATRDDLDSFLGDVKQGRPRAHTPSSNYEQNSDSEDDMGHNPMVADFADDVDSGDEALYSKPTSHVPAAVPSDSSEDDRPIVNTPVKTNQINKVRKKPLDVIPLDVDDTVDNKQPIIASPREDVSDFESENDFKIRPQNAIVATPDENESEEDEQRGGKEQVTIPSPLEYEDLSVLESFGVNNKYAIRSSSVTSSDIMKGTTTPELSDPENSAPTRKHRKHREKTGDEKSHRKHKHKKHKERDRDVEKRPGAETGGKSHSKTSSSKDHETSPGKLKKQHSKESTGARPGSELLTTGQPSNRNELNELEEFLGGGEEGYESI